MKNTESEFLYLVGDIVDGWRIKRSWWWPQEHNDVIQKILRKARKGTKVFFIPGNHDEFARNYVSNDFGKVKFSRVMIHKTLDGKKFLVIHGDECDGIMIYARWIAIIGDYAYTLALSMNTWLNRARLMMGLSYWSLSAYLKNRAKNAVKFINNYEDAIITLAQKRGADGVICGHIHHANIKEIDGFIYCNDGDWVESCTALVEHFDGKMEILRWTEIQGLPPLEYIDIKKNV